LEYHLIADTVTGAAPWIVRIEEVKAAMTVNEEAERKVAQLNEEMQGLARTLKSKEQNIQESAVKIELMERRMEAAKKQAEAVTDLEGQLGKAQKQEKYYMEAMEQLQSEFDSLEKENSKLKATTNTSEKEGMNYNVFHGPRPHLVLAVGTATPMQSQIVLPVDGNLETTHLLEQVCFPSVRPYIVSSTRGSWRALGALFASCEWKIPT
jgi:dynactin 1